MAVLHIGFAVAIVLLMAAGQLGNRRVEEPEDASPPLLGVRAEDGASIFARLAERRLALMLITALGALLYLLNIAGYPIYTKGEAREAVTVFDIVNGGGVILPMRAGVEIPSKPLLMHWMAALVSLIGGGVSEWSVRLPSALCAIGGMIACYYYIRRLFDQRVGLIAAIILGTTFQYLQAGTGARVDMTLAFFMEVAFFEFIAIAEGLRTRVWLMYLALACAVLTKGPIGAALPILVAMLWIAIYRRLDLLPRLKLIRGALIVIVIGGGWYAAASMVGGMAFVRKQILNENIYRLIGHAGVSVGHAHPFYYEDLALLAGFMPWTLPAVVALVQAIRKPLRIDSRLGYLLIWTMTVLLFYNFPQSKRGVYLLAMYPALSALVAVLLCDAIASGNYAQRIAAALARSFGFVLFLMGIGAIVGIVVLKQQPEQFQAWLSAAGIFATEFRGALSAAIKHWPIATVFVPTLAIAGGTYLLSCNPSVGKLFLGVLEGLVCGVLAVHLIIEPAIAKTLALDHFAHDARELAHGMPIGYFGSLDYDFAFYSGRNLMLTNPRDPAAPDFIVSPESDWNRQPLAVTAHYTVLILSRPTDLDGGGRMLLLRRKSGAFPKLPDFYDLSI